MKKILICLICVLLFAGCGNNEVENNKPDNENQEVKKDENLELINKELNTLISYLNGKEELLWKPCGFLNMKNNEVNLDGDFIVNIAPHIMECMYDTEYIKVNNIVGKTINGHALMTFDQYASYEEYFITPIVLRSYDDYYDRLKNNKSDLKYNISKDYLNKNYYIAYDIVGFQNVNDAKFSYDNLSKNDKGYQVKIKYNNGTKEYSGDLYLEVYNNHIKFGSLYLK